MGTLFEVARGLETGSRRTSTGTKLETATIANGNLRGTVPVFDTTTISGQGRFSGKMRQG